MERNDLLPNQRPTWVLKTISTLLKQVAYLEWILTVTGEGLKREP